MKTINNYGSLTATTIKDADGFNIYVENNITKTEHLYARVLNNDPVINYFNALAKIKASANELNEYFKQL